MDSSFDGKNRRKHNRIHKNFLLSYHLKNDSQSRFDVTQLKDISRGGMCFLSSKYLSPEMELAIELKTPFISEAIYFEGKVIESREKLANIIFEIRVVFNNLSPIAEQVLHKLEQIGFKGE